MKIEFLDTTLRDGAQSEGISYSENDKKSIMALLDDFGIDLIEGGDPASNPKDEDFFRNANNKKLVAFGSTVKPNKQVYEDAAILKLLEARTNVICIFGKSSRIQVKEVLMVTPENNLEMIAQSVAFLKGQGKRVIFDAEHFFDGYAEDSNYAIAVLSAAFMSGADTLTLCDTNGATSMDKIFEITKRVAVIFDGAKIGIHTHNDTGMAVANTITAVKAGATHVQGTFLGFGERCGNANLSTVIANLKLKENLDVEVNIADMTKVAHAVAEISNIKLDGAMPYVGASAFAHKAGMHADAVVKNPNSFEHIEPSIVGNRHRILLSEMAGRSAVAKKLKNLFPNLDKSDPKTQEILDAVKNLEMKGYQFDGADGSFILLAERVIGEFKPSFELIDYCINTTKPQNENTAEIKIKVGDSVTTAIEKGNGPVNALDKALRTALSKHFPQIEEVSLIDYKVRVVDSTSATKALVRVMISSTDHEKTWTTVGVSTDIIEASWSALIDSFEYKLTGQGNIIN